MEIYLAKPRGFCAGVDRAIEIVEKALEKYGAPVFVLHEIVHNKHVLEDLRARGVRFVDSLEEVAREGLAPVERSWGGRQAGKQGGEGRRQGCCEAEAA
jgi:4-hydroxy-3-methylbut-2-enyl diphosphate reductase IspH